MAFAKTGSLDTHGAPILRKEIITDSVVVVVTESMKLASGFIALGTTGALVFGHAQGIATKLDVGVNTTGVAGAELGSFVGSYTAASDNESVAQVKAECDVSKHSLYSVDPDAAIGTTTGSDLAGYATDLADSLTTDENTAHASNTLQYKIWGVDPNDSGNQIVNIFESQVFGV